MKFLLMTAGQPNPTNGIVFDHECLKKIKKDFENNKSEIYLIKTSNVNDVSKAIGKISSMEIIDDNLFCEISFSMNPSHGSDLIGDVENLKIGTSCSGEIIDDMQVNSNTVKLLTVYPISY